MRGFSIFVRTRTGKKIHLSDPGSSVCRCGHWLKVSGIRMMIDAERIEAKHLCECCVSPEAADKVIAEVRASQPTQEEVRIARRTGRLPQRAGEVQS